MRLAISNIAWDNKQNENMYYLMSDMGFTGIEIAPTKIFDKMPYDKLEEAKDWSIQIENKYGLKVASMQSIWYGKTENIFSSLEERKKLLNYTKKAVLFAEIIGCRNLVFGCPKNRTIDENSKLKEAVSFFRELGEFAYHHNTVIGMEANPTIYNTNYINTTISAIDLIKEVASKGFRLNLDFGTIVQNQESLEMLYDNVDIINHVHISEPRLEKIKKRKEHQILAEILKSGNYQNFISIEMKQQEDTSDIEKIMNYLKEVFI